MAGQEAGKSISSSLPVHLSPSRYFSDAVSTPQNRDIFTNNIVAAYKQYNLDGIDVDWEYPGQVGQQGNGERAADAANMLQFFKDLRRKLDSRALLSAAVQDSTFTGSDSRPMNNVSNFSEVLDWITLMNYDAYQSTLPSPISFISLPLPPQLGSPPVQIHPSPMLATILLSRVRMLQVPSMLGPRPAFLPPRSSLVSPRMAISSTLTLERSPHVLPFALIPKTAVVKFRSTRSWLRAFSSSSRMVRFKGQEVSFVIGTTVLQLPIFVQRTPAK